MRTLVAIAILLAGATALHAAEAPPVLVYPCERVAAPPVVDGRLDDAAWEKAALVSGFTYHDRRELVPVQTAFRVVYDAQALYVGVRCEEPLWQKMVPGAPGMRDTHGAVFGGEAIELFIDPKHNHSDYYQIAANSDATLFDGKGTDSAWNSRAKVATRISEGGWSLEIALPWTDFEVRPEPGLVIGFNVCRDRNIAPDKLWSTWAPIAANFHDPLRFGHLVLSATPEMIGRLGDEFRKGGLAGPIRVFAAEGFSGTTYLALAARSLETLEATLKELDSLRQQEKSPAVAAALAKRIAAAREMTAPIAVKVKGNQAFDAAEWVRADSQMQQLRLELEKAVWNTRLEALLSGI